ncbi:hypothetical protein A2572_00870 [Candidatus Collierbacteria bacterium RIFOXYD1_FULL_40_9]|uniref:Uncharacterized protein n=1 Tax=Candidatus Collierbacteria bacterium RIFOXYD1_FULL_40_9 TaxID=1817731 RepID=A0A1F5FVW1_9BACT|nr:MAG: hypothetical protein A2572_00870 [Candidatus Collierbacteria bacterium RIFOXYD1_FULL_40_9]
MFYSLIPTVNAAAVDSTQWDGRGCSSDGVVTIKGLECLIENILTPLPGIIALVAVGMIIFAGIKILNAGADTKAYAAGWSTFSFAVVGLILLSVVWLVLVIIKNYTGADILNFGIKP